jgi:hypothetical protein
MSEISPELKRKLREILRYNIIIPEKMETIQEKLWGIVNEYTREMCNLLQLNTLDVDWIGVDKNHNGTFDVCILGDYYFSFSDMQTVINNLGKWRDIYGSNEKVRNEIFNWYEWALEPENLIDGHAKITLQNWLAGNRELLANPYIELCNNIRILEEHATHLALLIEKYRDNRSLGNVLKNVKSELSELVTRKKELDDATNKDLKNSKTYKELQNEIATFTKNTP